MTENLFDKKLYTEFPLLLEEGKYKDIISQVKKMKDDLPMYFNATDEYDEESLRSFLDELTSDLEFLLSNNDDCRFTKFKLFFSFNDYAKAIALIEELTVENPSNIQYLEGASRVYYFSGEYETALSFSQKLLFIDTNNNVGNWISAVYYAKLNDNEKTVKHVQCLIINNLNDIKWWRFLRRNTTIRGLVQYPQFIKTIYEENKEKISDFDVKLFIQEAYMYRQKSRKNKEEIDIAKSILDGLFKEHSSNPKLLMAISSYWDENNNTDFAIKFAEKACTFSDLYFSKLGYLYQNAGDKRKALENYIKSNKIKYSKFETKRILSLSSNIDMNVYENIINELIDKGEVQLLIDHYIDVGATPLTTKVFECDLNAMKSWGKNPTGKMYFIYKLFEITDNFENKGECRKGIIPLYDIVDKIINNMLFNTTNVNFEICHYSKIESLQYLLTKDTLSDERRTDCKKSRFRIYNVAYMNDPSEGTTLFEILKKIHPDCSKIIELLYPNSFNSFQEQAEYNFTNTYLGSFSLSKDQLPMWVQYGDDGKGCCYVFNNALFNNPTRLDITIGDEQKNSAEVVTEDNNIQRERVPNLLEVKYFDVSSIEKNISSNPNWKKRELAQFEVLGSAISKLESWIFSSEKMRNIVLSLIDQIRFLFKDIAYRHENEARVVIIPSEDDIMLSEANSSYIVPKLYVELDNELLFDEIILGPKVQKPMDIVPFILHSGKVNKVTKSKIRYQ